MTSTRLTLALLCLAPLALGAAPYLGSPWPGVALVALALVPQAWEAYIVLRRAMGQAEALQKRIEALEDSVRSLNNRKVFGG